MKQLNEFIVENLKPTNILPIPIEIQLEELKSFLLRKRNIKFDPEKSTYGKKAKEVATILGERGIHYEEFCRWLWQLGRRFVSNMTSPRLAYAFLQSHHKKE